MIQRARIQETLFRHSAKGREALAPPGEGGHHVHYQPLKRSGLGTITSSAHPTSTFWELLAWRLSGEGDRSQATVPGCTATQAKKLFEEGLLQ